MVTYEIVKDKNTAYACDCFILITIKVDRKNTSDSVGSLLCLLYSQLDISGSPILMRFLCLSLFLPSQRGHCFLSSWISYHFYLCWFVYRSSQYVSCYTAVHATLLIHVPPPSPPPPPPILTMKKLMMMVMSVLKTKLFTMQTT